MRLLLFMAALGALVSCLSPIDLSGYRCDQGACGPGFECHPLTNLCVTNVERGCGGGAATCWSSTQTGDGCAAAGGYLPCGPVDDCAEGCRTCVDGRWSACEGGTCEIGILTSCASCGDNCDIQIQNADPACVASGDGHTCDYAGPCAPAFADADGDRQNGCECGPVGSEVCNGIDDDCDGGVDEIDSSVADLGCGGGEVCDGGACRCGSVSGVAVAACSVGQICCADACVSPGAPTCACGNGPSCGPDERCCGSPDACVSILTSTEHCGDCDAPCAGHLICAAGDCECADIDETDCGTVCANTDDDAAHCGACGNSCADHPNVDTGENMDCTAGACVYVCAAGFADCTAGNDGCETDTDGSTADCGACNNDCASKANVDSATCAGGACVLTCDSGFADCDGNPNNGCEPRDGSSAACAGVSCASLLAAGETADGVYFINPDAATPFEVVCDMTGGGWTLLLKATAGTTFQYSANYWTTANTLNPTDLSRADGDAKYASFNRLPVTDLRANWPDFADPTFTWLELGIWAPAVTALTGFSVYRSMGLPQSSGVYDTAYFSAQVSQACVAGQEVGRYGINLNGTDLCASCSGGAACIGTGGDTCAGGAEGMVRWGFRFNENGCCQWRSDDAGGGIGLGDCAGRNYSAGDWRNCCTENTGINRSARVEIWGR